LGSLAVVLGLAFWHTREDRARATSRSPQTAGR
jgi:hypothetical protein